MKIIEGRDFYEFANVSITDSPQQTFWCGKRNVVIVTQRAYIIVDWKEQKVRDLALVHKGVTQPCAVYIPQTKMICLLASEKQLLFYDRKNRKISFTIKLEYNPSKLISIYPFIAYIKDKQVEIRDILRDSMHNGTQVIKFDTDIYCNSNQHHVLWRSGLAINEGLPSQMFYYLQPRPLKIIVQQLCDQNLYIEALEICSTIKSDGMLKLVTLLQDQIRIKYGIHLFNNGLYEEGLAQLSMSKRYNSVLFLKLLPNLVFDYEKLRNLPCIIPENEFPKVEVPQESDLQNAAGCIYPYLMSYRSRLIQNQIENNYNFNKSNSKQFDQDTNQDLDQQANRMQQYFDNIYNTYNNYEQHNDGINDNNIYNQDDDSNSNDSEDLNYSVNYLTKYIQQEDAGFLDMLQGWSQQQKQDQQSSQSQQLTSPYPNSSQYNSPMTLKQRSPLLNKKMSETIRTNLSKSTLQRDSINTDITEKDLGDQQIQQNGEKTSEPIINGQADKLELKSQQSLQQQVSNKETEDKESDAIQSQDKSSIDDIEDYEIEYENPDNFLTIEQRKQLMTLLDTAIMKTLLILPDTGSLLQFTQRSTYIDEQVGVVDLSKKGRYAELCAIYSHYKRHAEAMEILRKCSLDVKSLDPLPEGAAKDLKGMTGVWAAIRYLLKIDELDLGLIKQHLRWILKEDADAGILVFLNEQVVCPPNVAISMLQQFVPNAIDFVQQYLEEALSNGIADRKVYDVKLAEIYIEKALVFESELGPPHKLMRKMQIQNWEDNSITQKIENQNKQQLEGLQNLLIQDLLFPDIVEQAQIIEAQKDGKQKQKPQRQEQIYMDLYFKLRYLIITSRNLQPDKLLRNITSTSDGSNSLLEIQALLLERLGLHHQALKIYVNNLQETKLAEQYCDRVYEALIKEEMETQLQNSLLISLHQFLFSKEQKDYTQLQPQQNSQNKTDNEWKSTQQNKQYPSTGKQYLVHPQHNMNQDYYVSKKEDRFKSPEPGDIYLALVKQFINGPAYQFQQPYQNNLHQKELQSDTSQNANNSILNSDQSITDSTNSIQQTEQDKSLQQENESIQDNKKAKYKGKVLDQLCQMLRIRIERINVMKALYILPDNLPYHLLQPFINSALTRSTQTQNSTRIVRQLRKTKDFQQSERLVKLKEKFYAISYDSSCFICHKKLVPRHQTNMQNVRLTFYPSKRLSHHSCYLKQEKQRLDIQNQNT